MPFRFERLEIPDVLLVEAKAFGDDRGYFMELYKDSDFATNGIADRFVQDNYSHSVGPVLRGLHYQKNPKAQGKLVLTARGEVFDVAVDLRKGSPSYGRWVSAVLSRENRQMLWVPPGFAHGFCAVSDEADVLYKVTAEYAPDLERGVRWNDPDLGIDWPVNEPILSPKDRGLPVLRGADHNFVYEG